MSRAYALFQYLVSISLISVGTAVYETCLETVILFIALFVAANGKKIANCTNKCNFDNQIFVIFVFLTKKQ